MGGLLVGPAQVHREGRAQAALLAVGGRALGEEQIPGVTLEGEAAADLADALKATFERDPQLYYEDGYQQELVNRGFKVDVAPIGDVKWVEIDNHDDLAKGREIACQY
ncbi:hypothetical protein STENM36S_01570 [Streptomyces tendae]